MQQSSGRVRTDQSRRKFLDLPEVSLAGHQVQASIHQLWREPIREWCILCLDVETAPHEDNRIFKLGAVRSDGDRSLTLFTTKLAAAEVAARVEELAAGTELMLGHNLRRHDLVELKRQYPDLQCTSLLVLDTLELSALAFPKNPYHRLVKGYKLVSDSRNEPERALTHFASSRWSSLFARFLKVTKRHAVLPPTLADDPGRWEVHGLKAAACTVVTSYLDTSPMRRL